MPSDNLDIMVDGRWLALDCRYGDVQLDTVWPGGSDVLSWALGTQPTRRFRGGQDVAAYFGGLCVWCGKTVEPDPSQDQLSAQGAFHEGDNYVALDSSKNATKTPGIAIDQANLLGLNWDRSSFTFSPSAADIDVSQGPVKVGSLLDSWSEQSGLRWAVDPYRQFFLAADPTIPQYKTNPLDGGLGYALDNYASTLYGRYLDSVTGTYKTVTVTDFDAEDAHGHVEDDLDLTVRGPITFASASNITSRALSLGRAIPQWAIPIELSYGDILTMGGTPAALETIRAGKMLRIPGGFELAQRLNGQTFLDIVIGHTSLTDGILTVQPMQIATRNLEDFVTTAAPSPKK